MNKQPLLVLAVGDPFLTQEALERKVSSFVPPPAQGNLRRLFAKDVDWYQIFQEARTYPFLSEHQVFWIKQAEFIGEEDLELLGKYFENPAPFSTFLFESESFGGKKRFANWVESVGGECLVFEAKGGWKNKTHQAGSFIREKLRALKLRITPSAQRLLEESCGEHFLVLANTLEKLSLKAGVGGEITEKDVEALADEINDQTGFDLAEALASKKMSRVFEIYFNLYEENPYQSGELLGLLNWQIRKIYEGKRLLKNGASRQELASKLKMSPYFVDRFITHIQAFDERKLERAFGLLMETDEAVKTGKVEVKAALEMLLLRLGLS